MEEMRTGKKRRKKKKKKKKKKRKGHMSAMCGGKELLGRREKNGGKEK